MRSILLTLLFFYNLYSFSQVTYYQDIFRGGICVVGVSTSNVTGDISLPIHISNNGTIKKIFLVTFTILNESYVNDGIYNASINNQSVIISKENDWILNCGNNFLADTYTGHRTHITDLTENINITGSFIDINWNNIQTPPNNCPACVYAAPVILILYDDINLDYLNINFMINNQANDTEIKLNFQNMNPYLTNKDIGFGVHSDRLSAPNDGYNFVLNNNSIGSLSKEDTPTISTGVIGNYYFENGIMYGLSDDIANSVLYESDGIIKINNYINSLNGSELKIKYLEPTALAHNTLIALYFAYSTPCQPFSVATPNDTLICQNSTLQLSASGGTKYEWLPATGLSCSDCPNPIFTADSSMFYTVRIWNNDSCSVVRPLKINVRLQPVFSEILTTKSECGTSTGSVTANSTVQGASYSLDGGAVQSSGFFPNLPAGGYILTLHDANGCTNDTLITIEDTVTVSAQFSINPSSGAAPLTVQITNESQNATDFEWFVNSISQGNSLSSYTFDSSGVYQLTLYAWQNNPNCIDSFSLTVQVFYSLMVEIPNVFTPNNDGVNDFFGITVNLPTTVNYRIFNRWGNEMVSGNGVAQKGVFVELWDGTSTGSVTFPNSKNASEGVYFYQLELVPIGGKKVEMNGFFEMRN